MSIWHKCTTRCNKYPPTERLQAKYFPRCKHKRGTSIETSCKCRPRGLVVAGEPRHNILSSTRKVNRKVVQSAFLKQSMKPIGFKTTKLLERSYRLDLQTRGSEIQIINDFKATKRETMFIYRPEFPTRHSKGVHSSTSLRQHATNRVL